MPDLIYRPAALADLDSIYDYIEPDSPRRAASFVKDIRVRCRLLCEHPMLGPSRDQINPGPRIYPMLGRVVVCYRLTESQIVVLRVFYGRQDYDSILRDSEDL